MNHAAALLAVIGFVAAALPAGPHAGRVVEDFEALELDAAPKGFRVASTLGEEGLAAIDALWRVGKDGKAPSGARVVALRESRNRGAIYNLLLREEPAPADLSLSVALRADSGREDRGGGLVWRALDASNYYVCRWNPLESNLRVYRTERGRRIQMQSVPVEAEAAAWHTLAVTMKGRVIEVSFDGVKRITCADPTFAAAGQVGLWTRSDACTSFDDLAVGPAE